MNATILTLRPGHATLADLRRLWREDAALRLDPSCRGAIEASAAIVARAAAGTEAVYGVNTGFGKLASVKIAPEDTEKLQRNLILSHCAGVGDEMPAPVVRLMMALKLLSLGRGASGVRWDIGRAEFAGRAMPGAEALAAAGLSPVTLGPKEGLALINGTQFSTAYALAGLFGAEAAAQSALITSAVSTDAIMGSTAPLHPAIHDLRGHPGQIAAASAMRALLDGSAIRESHRTGDTRVQDPYCIRCQPQVTGAALDVLSQAARMLVTEANAATDNPLVLADDGQIVSGGNFHAEPVGFAADMTALAIAEIGAIAQRRIALMVDPALSFDLPPFLTPDPGLNSGFMIAEVTSAALMSENKHLAHPTVTDSTPTSANQEDHVSMAAHGARRLVRMVGNLEAILGVELLCAAQGVEFRAPLQTSAPLVRVIARLRRDVPALQTDRPLSDDIALAAALVRSGALREAADVPLPHLH